MVEKADALNSITILLKEGHLDIQELSNKVNLDKRTLEKHLKLLVDWGIILEKSINKRTFYLKEENNYFKLPIKQQDQNTITTIYNKIKQFCQEIYFKEPTKTQVYKIIFLLNKKFNLNLPIGWYLYGPCCVQTYQGDEEIMAPLNKEQLTFLKEATEKYCTYDNIELQKEIYKKEHNELYQAKEELISLNYTDDKQILNPILMKLIDNSSDEATSIITDFARLTLYKGWNSKIRDCFNNVWKYMAIIEFKNSLEYDDIYFQKQLNSLKKDLELEMLNISKF
jgi:predicted transcriptional regulator